jgi:hypothetical protein
LEFSFSYANIGDRVIYLHEDIGRDGRYNNPNNWYTSFDYLKIQSGKVYAISGTDSSQSFVDTGMTVEADKWYRIALEHKETSTGRWIQIYLNGQPIGNPFNTGGSVAYDNHTYLQLKHTNSSTYSYIMVDDVSVHEGLYNPTVDDPSYTSDAVSGNTISVPKGTTASEVTAMVTPTGSGTPFVMKKQTGVAEAVTGAVADGNVLVIPSTSGKSMSYVNISTYDVAPTFVGTPEKVTADGIDAVAFFGEITDAGTSSDWGITVSLPELGSRDIVIGKEVPQGGLPFGVILTNLKDGWRDAMTAAYKN